jgi:hypothetical protein
MAIQCTGIQLAGGLRHEHISNIRWAQDNTNNAGICSRAQMVTLIERGGTAYVKDAYGNAAFLRVRIDEEGQRYLQAQLDGAWGESLLALPHF